MSWGPAATWHSKMFDELSEEIFKATQVVLSVTTLKRFFGVVKHGGSPSITTLDALAKFIGEGNWTSFKTRRRKKISIKTPGKSTYVTLGFILAIITISLFSSRRPELVINSSEFEFSSNVLSTEYPNSVVFDFKIPDDLVADSFQIQQYWANAITSYGHLLFSGILSRSIEGRWTNGENTRIVSKKQWMAGHDRV